MYILTISGNKAATVNEEAKYIYEFSSKEEAKEAIDKTEQFYVVYQPGNRGRLINKEPSTLQSLKVINNGYSYDEL